MLGVTGQWALEVLLDGQDLKLTPDRLANFSIFNNIHQNLPTVNFSFKDDTGAWVNRQVNDGTSVKVSIGLPDALYEGLDFITMGPGDSSGRDLTVRAALNKMNWLRKVVDKHHEGNSSDVLSALASEVGLTIDADTTNDKMIWLPNRLPLAEYARHVVDRAFSTEGSALLMAVTDSGKLRFKDLEKLISGGARKVLATAAGDGDFKILTWDVSSKGHVANNSTGYGSTSIGMDLKGEVKEFTKVATKLFSGSLGISSVIQDALGAAGGRIRVMAPLAGNTHDKWYEALHNNERIKSTYAYDIEMVTDTPTRLELLDVVQAKPATQGGKVVGSLVGNYIVTAMTKFIQNGRYFEKIVGTAQGPGGV